MKLFFPLILSLVLTGCVDIPMPSFFGKKDEATSKDKIQENKSEAQMAQQEYQELQETRTAQ